jgi:hypothetical protein
MQVGVHVVKLRQKKPPIYEIAIMRGLYVEEGAK